MARRAAIGVCSTRWRRAAVSASPGRLRRAKVVGDADPNRPSRRLGRPVRGRRGDARRPRDGAGRPPPRPIAGRAGRRPPGRRPARRAGRPPPPAGRSTGRPSRRRSRTGRRSWSTTACSGAARRSRCPASAGRRRAPRRRPAAGRGRLRHALGRALLSYLPVAAVHRAGPHPRGGRAASAAPRTPGWPAGCSATACRSAPRSARSGWPPLLLTLLVVWRLNRAGLHVTRAIGARRSGSIGDALLVGVRDRR